MWCHPQPQSVSISTAPCRVWLLSEAHSLKDYSSRQQRDIVFCFSAKITCQTEGLLSLQEVADASLSSPSAPAKVSFFDSYSMSACNLGLLSKSWGYGSEEQGKLSYIKLEMLYFRIHVAVCMENRDEHVHLRCLRHQKRTNKVSFNLFIG